MKIAPPAKLRARYGQYISHLEIKIRAVRHWPSLVFLVGWLGIWAIGVFFVFDALIKSNFQLDSFELFILFWLAIWIIGGFRAFSGFLWSIFGREYITVTTRFLTIKRGVFLLRKKEFEVSKIQELGLNHAKLFGRIEDPKLSFNYGDQTIEFGGEIDASEANFMLKKLKACPYLKKKYFSIENIIED